MFNENKILNLSVFFIFTGFVIHYTIFPYLEYINFNTSTWDTAIYFHYVTGISEGCLKNSVRNLTFFAHHIQFILFPVAVISKLFNTPFVCIISQVLLTGLAGIYLYKLSLVKFKDSFTAFLIIIIFFLFPVTGYSLLFEFHPILLGIFFITGYFYYDEKKKNKTAVLFLIAAVLCEENIALIVSGIGLNKILSKQVKKGLQIFVLSSLYFIIAEKYVKPAIGNTDADIHLYYFYHLGRDYKSIITGIIKNPVDTVKVIFTPLQFKLRYILNLFGPFLFIPVFYFKYFVIILPVLFINLISNNPATSLAAGSHYSAIFIPVLIVAVLNVIERFNSKIRFIVVIVMLSITIFIHIKGDSVKGPSVFSYGFDYEKYVKPNIHSPVYKYCLKIYKPGEKMSCDVNLACHLIFPGKISIFPNINPENTKYAVINYDKDVLTYIVDEAKAKRVKKNDYRVIENELIKEYGYKKRLVYKNIDLLIKD